MGNCNKALVDGKKVIVTEQVERALQFKRCLKTECLPNVQFLNKPDTHKGYENLTQKRLHSIKLSFHLLVLRLLLGMNLVALWPQLSSVLPQTKNSTFPSKGSKILTDPQHTPTIIPPSTSKPQKKQSRRKQRKDTKFSQPSEPTEPMADETKNVESVPTNSNDPLFSGEDRLKLNELMELCTKLFERVLDLENTKTTQAAEITKLKERVKKLERMNKSRTPWLKRLRKVGISAQVVSSEDEGLGAQEDASKQGRKIIDLDVDAELVLLKLLLSSARHVQQLLKIILWLRPLIEIKAAKPKAVTTAATTTTTAITRPKARGVIVQEPSEFTTTTSPSQPSQLPQAKDKGKAKMVEPEKPLKKKDQIMYDQENNVQAMIEADRLLAERLQAREQEELTDEEKARLFVELLEKRKKHFAALRAQEKRNKPPTKAQKKSTMSTYLKHMAGYKQSQLKNKSFAEIQKLFDKAMTRVNISKRAGTKLEQEVAKKQKIDDDQEEAEMKKHMEIVLDEEEIAFDAIPLATKPLIIVDWKIIKEGKIGYFQIIKADASSKRYSSMIQMLQSIDREDLETLWKLVKAKHGLTRPDEAYERVL
ncbi:hypothetical protein Tco_0784574 [Tanacetum coccineum]